MFRVSDAVSWCQTNDSVTVQCVCARKPEEVRILHDEITLTLSRLRQEPWSPSSRTRTTATLEDEGAAFDVSPVSTSKLVFRLWRAVRTASSFHTMTTTSHCFPHTVDDEGDIATSTTSRSCSSIFPVAVSRPALADGTSRKAGNMSAGVHVVEEGPQLSNVASVDPGVVAAVFRPEEGGEQEQQVVLLLELAKRTEGEWWRYLTVDEIGEEALTDAEKMRDEASNSMVTNVGKIGEQNAFRGSYFGKSAFSW
ncbi:unnamed protein product [Amoebophrya sp. A120]|nr:unnamed protein product [Amoebophrya sp. A120]|eukprot:GSA120T00015167001.1